MPAINETTIVEAINRAIEQEVKKIAEEAIQIACKEVTLKVRESVGAITCKVLSHMSFERFGTDLRITVSFKEN